EKTVPEKTQPEKTQPEKTVPEKTQPEKTQPEKTVPEKTRARPTEPPARPGGEGVPGPIERTLGIVGSRSALLILREAFL
ncbi:hypothetical protein NSP26_24430, partial [Salmonella enterica]|nr:hypothetical protein [Salmonella enterica]